MRVFSPHPQASAEQVEIHPAAVRSFLDYLVEAGCSPRVAPHSASLAVGTGLAIAALSSLGAAMSGPKLYAAE